jgi:hypothetical protein
VVKKRLDNILNHREATPEDAALRRWFDDKLDDGQRRLLLKIRAGIPVSDEKRRDLVCLIQELIEEAPEDTMSPAGESPLGLLQE